ncbi:hypothetical protein M885DRAFT_621583 [Pelagophyceae sp. CCMP2097]|nr:hypothetical protein M885DRAFT_621583 [Pelagophyceae sp. CCMP2097]
MAAAMTPAATYIWVACAVGMTGALRGEYLDIYDVVWSWPLFADGEYFRAPLSLCFIGDTLTIWYGINLYFLYKNSADYEASLGSSALFLWHLLLGAFLVLCGAAVFDVSFPGLALASFVQSLWCSANPNQRVSLHGLVVPAKYLDAVLLVIKLFQGDSWRSQVIGLIAGHVAHSHFVLHPALCEPPFIKAAADLLQSSLQFWGPAAPSLLALGDHVVVCDLLSAPDLNGARGIVSGVLAGGRYAVDLPQLHRAAVSIQRANLVRLRI